MGTAKIALYESKKLSKGKYPITLRITSQGARKYVSLGHSAKPSEWEKLRDPDNNSQLAKLIRKRQTDADKILDRYEYDGIEFTVDQFYNEWTRRQKGTMTVFKYFDERIQEFKKEQRPGNATIYNTAKNYLSNYRKGKDLRFTDITPQFLRKFKSFLENDQGISGNTMSIYFRTLRAVYNAAIEDNHVSRDLYPFGRRRFNISKLSEETIKRTLTRKEIQKLYSKDLKQHPKLIDARNIFIFSYLVRGIQFYDIAHLSWDDIRENRIIYKRKKTDVYFNIKIHPGAGEILKYYSEKDTGRKYIFPILDARIHKTEQQKFDRINKTRKNINKKLRLLAILVEIDKPITTYWARHSYVSFQKDKGTPTPMIKELMGHSSEQVTQIYMKNWENEILDRLDEDLI
jgi:integrase